MTVCKDLQSLVVISLGEQETWRLWYESDEADLENGGECLDEGWGSPLPVVVDMVRPECQPCGDDASKVSSG